MDGRRVGSRLMGGQMDRWKDGQLDVQVGGWICG